MTVEAMPATAGAEERLRSRALDTLRTLALEVVLASDEPLRTVDIARLVSERLGVTLNEEEMGGLASVVRMVMDSDPLFSQSNRQWDLALRMGRAEGDRRKPVERAVEDFIELLGHPVEAHPVAVLVASVYGRMPDYYEKMIERIVPTRQEFFPVPGRRAGIRRWLLELSSEYEDELLEDNFPDTTMVDALRAAVDGIEGDDPQSYARAVVEKVGEPVDNRALQFVTWLRFQDLDPKDLFIKLYMDPQLRLERGPSWVTVPGREQVVETVRTLVGEPESAAEIVAAAVTVDEEDTGILAPTTVRVSDEDLDQVYSYLQQNADQSYRAPDLCQQVLEAFPGSRTYSGVHDSLLSRMREDSRFLWVGGERFRTAGSVPADITTLPEGLAFDEREYEVEEGAEADRVVDPREWKFNLDEQVGHYLVQDVGDDSTAPGSTPSRLEASAPLHHYVAGTYYLRHSDRGFFPASPDLVQVTLIPEDGARFDVWINNRLGLLFGIKEWYDANLPWVGGRFVLERTDQPDEFRLLHTSGDVEPLMEIPVERLQQILALRGEAQTEGLLLSAIVQRLLRMHEEGVHFVTLFTELNVVRRTRRAALASVLSAQRFFVQSPQQPGIWSYDEKRAQKGKTKKKGGPKRPMREMYNEDDDDEEFEYE